MPHGPPLAYSAIKHIDILILICSQRMQLSTNHEGFGLPWAAVPRVCLCGSRAVSMKGAHGRLKEKRVALGYHPE